MRRMLLFALLLASVQCSLRLSAQEPARPAPTLPSPKTDPAAPIPPPAPLPLPDSPGAVQTYRQMVSVVSTVPPPCRPGEHPATIHSRKDDPESRKDDPEALDDPSNSRESCTPRANTSPYQRFLNSPAPFPLTVRQKGLLALHNVVDPGNIFTLTANAAFTVSVDPYGPYGPGWTGFGRNVGYSFAQDATGEFLSTFAIDSLLHQDPHYHRSPMASVPRRFLHAISHTVISQHDDGTPMPNYGTLLTYPISAEISNLYVPGVHGNGPSTVVRIASGLATDPVDSLITEFLPDVAKRIHIRIIFVQQLVNNVARGEPL